MDPSRAGSVGLVFRACGDCDAVQTVGDARANEAELTCFRCGALLVLHGELGGDGAVTRRRDRALAFILAAIPLFIAAQLFPLMRMDGHDSRIAVTVLGAVQALHQQRMDALAALVLFTTVLLPALHLACGAYLLLFHARRGIAPRAATVLRLWTVLRPWSQIDVLLFGMLVAFGKLATVFHLVPGAGLPCLVSVLLLDRLANSSFDLRSLWGSPAASPSDSLRFPSEARTPW